MSERVWTKAQKSAIDCRGRDLLISAAAGSGKTAVLTQRLVDRIADPSDPLTVDNAVVMTFTVAAAGELKERLFKGLNSAAAKGGGKRLRAQIAKLPSARISTVDSFCFSLIRENAAALNISPAVTVAEGARRRQLSREAARKVIRAYFEEEKWTSPHDAGDFLQLCTVMGIRADDSTLADMISQLYDRLRTYPAPMEILKNRADRLERELNEFSEPLEVFPLKETLEKDRNALAYHQKSLERAIELCGDDPKLAVSAVPTLKDELNYLKLLTSADVGSVRGIISQISFANLRVANNPDPETAQIIKDLRNGAKNAVIGFCTSYGQDKKGLLTDLRRSLALERVVEALITDYDREFTALKRNADLVDFADVEQLAAGLLCENVVFDGEKVSFTPSAASKALRSGICQLCVDEYQDTNLLQDLIFRAIAPPGGLFIVGDPKQSIYEFRGARPDVFTGYRDSFSDDPEGDGPGRIFLSDNFRCDRSVIDLTNTVFRQLMNTDPAFSLYRPEDELIKSKTSESGLEAEIVIINRSGSDGEEEAGDAGDQAADAYAGSDPEAQFAAQRIAELLREGALTDDGTPLSPDGIAVLSRTKDKLAAVRAELKAAGIPCQEDAGSSFFDAPEILFLTALLKLTDKPNDDIALAAVLNSPVFAFDPDMLVEIRRALPGSAFCAAARKAAEGEGKTADKLKDFFSDLEDMREFSAEATVRDTLMKWLEITDARNVFASYGGSPARDSNISLLLDLAGDCDRRPDRGLEVFISSLEEMKRDPQIAGDSGDGKVKLITIHQSKGLEFPCVILAGVGKRFNFRENNGGYLFDPAAGFAPRIINSDGVGKHRTLLMDAIWSKKQERIKEEEKRLLYVAFTRARQKLIVTGAADLSKMKKLSEAPEDAVERANQIQFSSSHLRQLFCVLPSLREALAEYLSTGKDTASENGTFSVRIIKDAVGQAIFEPPAPTQGSADFNAEKLREALDFEYAFTTLSEVPKKVSVSSLRPVLEPGSDPVVPLDAGRLFETVTSSGAFAGTAAHQFMQFTDYKKAASDIEAEASRLLDEGFISEKQFDALDFEELKSFFDSDIYRRIDASPRVMRELRFNVFVDASQLIPDAPHYKVLLQGVADCFFLEKDGTYTVLDFKTDRGVGENTLRERHRRQLEIYRIAVEKMTGKKVSRLCIYSFALGKEIEV